ncbi:DUF2190 family protein [Methylobacterium fujisawaense]|uniref:DUF2190 family protein n=1 Tax=Methylobacterium fujisawaense TaxID=107400 RepID=UPI00313D6223
MKNFVMSGRTMSVLLAAACASGDLIVSGSLFGIAAVGGQPGDTVEVDVGGVWDLPKKAGEAFPAYAPVYWDATNKVLTVTAGSNLKVGLTGHLGALAADTVARVRLNANF